MNNIIENMHRAIKIVQTFNQYMPELKVCELNLNLDTDPKNTYNDSLEIFFNEIKYVGAEWKFDYHFENKQAYLWQYTHKYELRDLPQEIINIINML